MFRYLIVCMMMWGAAHAYAASYLSAEATTTESASEVSQVSALLRECETHLQAHRLTAGQGGTALACYEAVLQQYTDNAEAWAGLDAIVAHYVKLAQHALDKAQIHKFRQYLAKLRQQNPDSLLWARLEESLQSCCTPPVLLNYEGKIFRKGDQVRIESRAGTFKPIDSGHTVEIDAGPGKTGTVVANSHPKESEEDVIFGVQISYDWESILLIRWDRQPWKEFNRPNHVVLGPFEATIHADYLEVISQ